METPLRSVATSRSQNEGRIKWQAAVRVAGKRYILPYAADNRAELRSETEFEPTSLQSFCMALERICTCD